MLAPYIQYSSDYTKVTGTEGVGFERRTIPVYIGKRARHFQKMTTEKWRYLRRDTDTEFTVNEALAEIGDPKLTGEVNRFRGLADIKDTMDKLLRDTTQCVNEIMREAVVIDWSSSIVPHAWNLRTLFKKLTIDFIAPIHSQSALVSPPNTLPSLLVRTGQLKCPCSPMTTAITVPGVLVATNADPPTIWCRYVPKVARTAAALFAAIANIGPVAAHSNALTER
jgi:hypothetical protein